MNRSSMMPGQFPKVQNNRKFFCHDHNLDLAKDSCLSEQCLVTPANFYKFEHGIWRKRTTKDSRWRGLGLKMKAGDSMIVRNRNEASNFHTSMAKLKIEVAIRKLEDGTYRVCRVK